MCIKYHFPTSDWEEMCVQVLLPQEEILKCLGDTAHELPWKLSYLVTLAKLAYSVCFSSVMAALSIVFRSRYPSVGLHFWVMFLETIVGLRAQGPLPPSPGRPDWKKYNPCDDHWDVRYPFLVEVKYSGQPQVNGRPAPFYHRPRHGSLFTPTSVLTRAHDLENYPAKGEKVPSNLDECMKGGVQNPCLFVNTRRPTGPDDQNVEYCGQNIVVTRVIPHPKFGQTAKNLDLDFSKLVLNQKFPFAILILQEQVKTQDNMTIFPGVLFPSTPLDLFYLLRRVASIGYDSHLCEFPHFLIVTYDIYFAYENVDEVWFHMLDCSKDKRPESDDRKSDRALCYKYAICQHDFNIRGYEGLQFDSIAPLEIQKYYDDCESQLLEPNVFKHSFFVFTGASLPYVPPDNRADRFDKMGTTVVCNGVALGLVSSWRDRGLNRQDAYVSTNFLRAWNWLMKQRIDNQVQGWHRAKDDSPFLGAKYNFKKRKFPPRKYDNSLFELSLNEKTIKPFSSGSQTQGSLGSVLLALLMTSY